MFKGKILIVLVIVLISLAGYYTYLQNRVLSSNDFCIKNADKITELHFEQGKNKVILYKKDKKWFVNDTFPANKSLIKRFFKIFSNLNLVAPVSKQKSDSIQESLSKSALKIKVFKNRSLKYEYLIGALNNSKTGNYVLCNNYLGLINSLGLYKDLRNIVSAQSLFWRNKIIFNKPVNEIKSIHFKNFRKAEQSFLITSENGKFKVFDYKNNAIEHYDTSFVMRYLSYFQNISFKQIENNLTDIQVNYILKNNKAYYIELVDQKNIKYQLNLYFKPQKSGNFKSKEFDLNLIYGKLNNEKNLLIFAYYELDPVLKELDWFVR